MIYILDFSVGHVFTCKLPADRTIFENDGEILDWINEKHGTQFSESNCQWMYANNIEIFDLDAL